MSLERAEARVQFDDTKISADKLAAAVDRLGYRTKVLNVLPAPR